MLAFTRPSKPTMAKMVTFFIKIYYFTYWRLIFPSPAMLGCRSVLPVASHELMFTPCSLLADGQSPWIWNYVVKLSKPIWSIVNSYPPIECWKHNHQLPKHWGADCLWGGEQWFFVLKKKAYLWWKTHFRSMGGTCKFHSRIFDFFKPETSGKSTYSQPIVVSALAAPSTYLYSSWFHPSLMGEMIPIIS